MDGLLTTAQAAKLLNVAVGSLQNWRCKGVGPSFVKLGRMIRYRAKDVVDFMNTNVRTMEMDFRGVQKDEVGQS